MSDTRKELIQEARDLIEITKPMRESRDGAVDAYTTGRLLALIEKMANKLERETPQPEVDCDCSDQQWRNCSACS